MLRHNLDAAVHVKGKPNKLMRDTRVIHRHAKICTDTESSHFEHLLYVTQHELHISTSLPILHAFNIQVIINP